MVAIRFAVASDYAPISGLRLLLQLRSVG